MSRAAALNELAYGARAIAIISVLALGGCRDALVEEDAQIATAVSATSSQTCVTIQRGISGSVADAFIRSNAQGKSFGTQPILRVSAKDESLLSFGLGTIPKRATISRATLKVYVNGANGDGSIRVHRIVVPWAEDTVTYAGFQQKFAVEAVGAFRVETSTALKTVDITQLVTNWVSGAAGNYGLVLKQGPDHHASCSRDEDDDQAPTLFVSSEATTTGKRPALEVCFSVPAVDYCSPNPCGNGGMCTSGASGFTCQCPPGFTGLSCETHIEHCVANPCKNAGVCADAGNGYTCACATGFAGANCETNVDDCTPNPCRNGGVCTDGIASHTCACAPGHDGDSCEHSVDSCAAEPCHNGGVCTNVPAGFTCACAPGYTGPTCDTNVDNCVGNACVNGTCVDGLGGYTCSCAPDWGGERCDVNLNACAQRPCLNGAFCTNGSGTYACQCAPGYAGTNCEVDIDDCAARPCTPGALCVDEVNAYSCVCPPGHSGPSCDTPLALSASTTTLAPDTSVTLSIAIAEPAEAGGTIVSIGVAGQGATCPDAVVVPPGQTTATFNCINASSDTGPLVVTASIGSASDSVVLQRGGTAGCEAGQLACAGVCTNTSTDPRNCGGCGSSCAPSAVCEHATCSCPADLPNVCGPACTSLQTDAQNCGACGKACGGLAPICVGGVCTAPDAIPVGTALTISVPVPPDSTSGAAVIGASPADAASCPQTVSFPPDATSITFTCETTSPSAASGQVIVTFNGAIVSISIADVVKGH